jgi:hypothetical protein
MRGRFDFQAFFCSFFIETLKIKILYLILSTFVLSKAREKEELYAHIKRARERERERELEREREFLVPSLFLF